MLPLLAPGYARESVNARDFGHVIVELVPQSEILGVVVRRADEKPIAGAIVRAGAQETESDASGKFQLGGLAPGCRTDSDGRCELYGLAAGVLDFDAPGEQQKTLPDDNGAEVQFEVPAVGSVLATVADDAGKPLSGWTVGIPGDDDSIASQGYTDVEGRALLTDLPVGPVVSERSRSDRPAASRSFLRSRRPEVKRRQRSRLVRGIGLNSSDRSRGRHSRSDCRRIGRGP